MSFFIFKKHQFIFSKAVSLFTTCFYLEGIGPVGLYDGFIDRSVFKF